MEALTQDASQHQELRPGDMFFLFDGQVVSGQDPRQFKRLIKCLSATESNSRCAHLKHHGCFVCTCPGGHRCFTDPAQTPDWDTPNTVAA